MSTPRLVVCSGFRAEREAGRRVLELNSIGRRANVHIRFENVARVSNADLPPRLVDLVEIAAYIYTADCATQRGKTWSDGATESWDRDFRFRIPVRDYAFWSRPEIQSKLVELLEFLTDDRIEFQFSSLDHDRELQQYIQFGPDNWPFQHADRVLMFSGGLDSLAGAVDTAAKGSNLILVSHRPVAPLDSRQKLLFQALKARFQAVQMLHVPVWVNKDTRLGREPTQRSRSFLYGALGLAVAASTKAAGLRFFENGIVSLNLPVADEVLRARASRTTHPAALHMMQEIFSEVLERLVVVDNPFLCCTKAEVVSTIRQHSAETLIAHTCSCAHSIFKPKQQWHCGACSQCIDRRFALFAAGLGQFDPETDYESDVFVGPRREGSERNMAVDYVRHGLELNRMHEVEMAERFNLEFVRATRYEAQRSETARA